MFLLIDNYDSFTFNLWHYLGELGAEVEVVRNDAITAAAALAKRPQGIVLSPGPCDPDRAGICLEPLRQGGEGRIAGRNARLEAVNRRVGGGARLSAAEAEAAFEIMMSGNATPAQMGGFLMALRVRGETVEEVTGAARAMRAKALKLDAPLGAIDTCGTGGDAPGTFNVSTPAPLVGASLGLPCAQPPH